MEHQVNSQELRIMAAYSQDENMLNLINTGQDLHCFTVRKVYPACELLSDDEIKEEHPEKRDGSKATMFGTAYGIGPGKLSETLRITKDEAKHLINTLKYEAYPGLGQWLKDAENLFIKQGYADLPGGYRRRHDGWQDAEDPEAARMANLRSCVNTLIQGEGARQMKQAWFRVEDAYIQHGIPYQLKILIHDQMVAQVPKAYATLAKKLMQEHMATELFGVPIPAEAELKTSLSKKKEATYEEDEDDVAEELYVA